jgi:hypothetical protein
MTDRRDDRTPLDVAGIGAAAAAITAMASTHGITGEPEPIDAFADAVIRLCATEVTFDHIELLLLGLARADLITDEQRFALHVAYLRQKAEGIRSAQ